MYKVFGIVIDIKLMWSNKSVNISPQNKIQEKNQPRIIYACASSII